VNEDNIALMIDGHLGYLYIQGELDKNKVSFPNKMFKSQHNVIKFVFDVYLYGKAEIMSVLCSII